MYRLMKKLGFVMLLFVTLHFVSARGQDVFSLTAETLPSADFSMAVLSVDRESHPDAPRIYLYHTHTYEAYSMQDGQTYEKTEEWRTADERYNIVRVGEELARLLEEAGFFVYHDRTAYEPPRLSSAYARSLEALEKTLAEPYDLYIDLHRDSYSRGNGPNTVEMDGKDLARLLILVGKGTGLTMEEERPDWQENEKIGLMLTDAMNAQAENLCRGVSLKSGRYNQHIAPNCLLIEVGNNQNTLTQALNAMPPLSLAVSAYFDGLD